MKQKYAKRLLAVMCALAVALAMSSCGGGGGGGTTTPVATTGGTTNNTTTTTTLTVSGTMNSTAAGRIAGRSAGAALANTPVVAFILGDADRTLINGATDATDANGNFSITLNIGTATSANVVIEAVPSGSTLGANTNIRVPLENLGSNLTGVSGDQTTSAQGLLWMFNPGKSLAGAVRPAVAFFAAENIDIRSTLNATSGESLMAAMQAVLTACGDMQEGSAKKTCVINTINGLNVTDSAAASLVQQLELNYKVDTSVATTKEKLQHYAPTQPEENIDAVIAMATAAGASLDAIDSSAEAMELLGKLEQSIASYKASFASELEKKISIKDQILVSLNAETFTSNEVQDILITMKAGYEGVIATEAAALSALVDASKLTSALSGYDNTLGMFVNVFVQKASANRFQAWAMVDGLIYCLGKLGETSESTASMGAVLDNWAPAYANAAFQDKWHTLLDPLGMNDRTKTANMMQLAHDLGDTDGSRAQVEDKLDNYLTAPTVTKAMALYDKYYGTLSCNNLTLPINFNNLGSNCPTQDEVVDLLETHFEKSLPVLDAVLTGLQNYVNNNTTKFAGLTSLNDIYTTMKASPANKTSLSPAVDAAGIDKELFWLVINLEPYI
jgi:hypothetical protein